MAALSHDQLKTLEQTRLRLLQLSQSISSLKDSIARHDPLPEWTSLQSRAAIISNNLSALSQHLSDNSALLSSLLAYPTPDYPGRSQAGILSQLMRTKLEPAAEDWIEKGRSAGTNASDQPGAAAAFGGGAQSGPPTEVGARRRVSEDASSSTSDLSVQELKKLWRWAPIEANRLARQRNWGGNYTLEERAMGIENVVTGLQRRHADEEEEEEDGDEEDGEGQRMLEDDDSQDEEERELERMRLREMERNSMLPVDDIVRFMATGVLPAGRARPVS
ncbi:mediator of RNA polymerase II transcription subunit 8 [Ascosphaera acerosa]|nr:mediator of RNA polymerase II transcription subunit 8 [Ascosphaera acerosa]